MSAEQINFPHEIRVKGTQDCPDVAIAKAIQPFHEVSIIVDAEAKKDGYGATLIFSGPDALSAHSLLRSHDAVTSVLSNGVVTDTTLRAAAHEVIMQTTD